MSNLENKVVTHITLAADASTHNRPSYVYAKQSDANSRYLVVRIVDSDGDIHVNGVAQLNATKPDGTHSYTGGIVNEDGTVTVALKSGLLAVEGEVSCDITVFDTVDNERVVLTTSTFFIFVDKSNYKSDAIESMDEFSTVSDILAQLAVDYSLQRGSGERSVVQKQGGAYNGLGKYFSQSTASGTNGVSLGANNSVDGVNGFSSGHDNKIYQYDGASVGAGNTVGVQKNQKIFDGIMKIAATEGYTTPVSAVNWLKTETGWNIASGAWNELYAEGLAMELELGIEDCKIKYSSFESAQQALKYSFGFAGGTGNKIFGRAGAGFGTHNTILGENTFGAGLYNEAGGSNSIFGGRNNYIGAGLSIVVGDHLHVTGGPKAVFGKYNLDKGNYSLLEVGYGTSDADRKNAFVVRPDGSAYLDKQQTDDNAVVIYKTLKDYAARRVSPLSGYTGAYVMQPSGTYQLLPCSSGVVAGQYSIPMRSQSGTCEFADPVNSQHAATKGYVDSNYISRNMIEQALDNIIAKQKEMM